MTSPGCHTHIRSVFHTAFVLSHSARMTLINDSRVRSLADRTRIEGTIVLPGDPAWDAARQAWNLAVDQRPAMVAFPESVEDVVGLVRLAEDANLAVVTQGTGHGATGYADLAGTLLIRTTRLRRMSIDGATCRAGAGALWGEVAEEGRQLGLAGLAGSSPDVGVVGYTLGGGIGWLSRAYGLAANRVRSIEIVIADATVCRVDRASDPDLFWALRGGGGGLGVITSIEFDLIPIDRVYAGTIAWNADRADTVLEAWSRWTAELDDSVTSIIRFLNLPAIPDVPEPFRGRRMLTLGAAAVGDRRKAEHAIGVLRDIGGHELDTFADMAPADLVRLHGDPEGPTPGMSHHTLLSSFGADACHQFDQAAGVASDTPLVSVEIRHLGGASGRPVLDGGVASHIDAPYVLNAVGMAGNEEERRATWSHLDAVVDAMKQWSGGSYLNFVERPDGSIFAAGTAARLRDVKSRVDPRTRFAVRTGLSAIAGT